MPLRVRQTRASEFAVRLHPDSLAEDIGHFMGRFGRVVAVHIPQVSREGEIFFFSSLLSFL